MKIRFSKGDPDKIIQSVKEEIEKKDLNHLVQIIKEKVHLQLKFTQLGTTTLLFREEPRVRGALWILEKEKVALTHRVFKTKMTEKVHKIIKEMGGELVT